MRHKTQVEATYFRRGGAPLSAMSGVAMVSEGVAWSDPGGGLGASAVDAMCSLSMRFSPILHSLARIQPLLPRRTFSFVLAYCSHFLFYCCLIAGSFLISVRLRSYVRAVSAFLPSHALYFFVFFMFIYLRIFLPLPVPVSSPVRSSGSRHCSRLTHIDTKAC